MADVEGADRVIANLVRLGVEAVPRLGAALFQEGEAIMTASKTTYVPVDRGTLRASGYVAPPMLLGTLVSVELGYGGPAAPYALQVHENPRAGKTGGVSPKGKKYKHFAQVGEWKYLETPFKLAAAGLTSRLAARLAI